MQTTVYLWHDVAVVYLLCALPLAMALAGFARNLPRAALMGLAVVLLGGTVLVVNSGTGVSRSATMHPFVLAAMRAGIALTLSLSAALAWLALRSPRGRGPIQSGRWLAAGLSVLIVIPCTYVSARSRHDCARLGELLEQSRLGEAQSLAQILLFVNPHAEWRGHHVSELAANIDQIVNELESRVAVPLAPNATPVERLQRARELAILARTMEALAVLDPVVGPHADSLRGMIHQSLSEWESSLSYYEKARTLWSREPMSAEQTAELARAAKGVAFSQRKMGRYADAEATYKQVLELDPSADTFFILAQFYDDAQQADKARDYARQAMALNPDRYRSSGESLIRKLTVFQFGCLGVFSAEANGNNVSLRK